MPYAVVAVCFECVDFFHVYLQVIDSKVAVPLPSLNPEFLPFILSGNTATIALDRVSKMYCNVQDNYMYGLFLYYLL